MNWVIQTWLVTIGTVLLIVAAVKKRHAKRGGKRHGFTVGNPIRAWAEAIEFIDPWFLAALGSGLLAAGVLM